MYRLHDSPELLQALTQERVLLACFRDGEESADQEQMLRKVSEACQEQGAEIMAVTLQDDSKNGSVRQAFNIVGTPTFLLLEKGEVMDRMFGLADEKALLEFVRRR